MLKLSATECSTEWIRPRRGHHSVNWDVSLMASLLWETGRNIVVRKFEKRKKSWDFSFFHRKAPTWANLREKIHLEDPTPLIHQIYLGCSQRAATVDEEPINAKTDLFERITTSSVCETLQNKAVHNVKKVSCQSNSKKEDFEIVCFTLCLDHIDMLACCQNWTTRHMADRKHSRKISDKV